ncbi:uncharacterized protein LOC122850610 [Aphidius gifuensis]|uniref:uncharacterized protein LOC122850610 n=1 Tax=Aphidius gifuensis TaxID=684658 RepID=UPI001CDBD211|nr:uncharacterized protein LOC122850610 [Aphidius gifuensis]
MDKQKSFDDDFEDKIMVLDYDSLAQIFMWLPVSQRIVMENVCHKWKEACQRSWYDITEYQCGVSIDDDYQSRLLTQSFVKKILLRCGVYLKELTLTEVCNSSMIISIVGERCKNLTKLELVFDETSRVNNNDYISTFTQLNKLVSIKIQKKNSKNFPDEIMNHLSEEINEIHLIFKYMSLKRPPIFFNLNKYKNLKSLTLRSCNLDDIIQDISKKSTLVYLDIRRSWALEKTWIFNDLVNLEHIDLLHCCTIMEQNILNVFSSMIYTCKNLKHLEYSSHYNAPEPEIPLKYWLNLKNLVYLSTGWNMTEDFAIKIVNYCKNLKDLTIKVQSTAAAIIKLTELENLECLKINYQELTKEEIIAISNNCKKLKHLEILYSKIKSCPFYLDLLSKLQYLEYLDLSGIKILQDSTIMMIADTHLKYLKIKGPNKLTEIGFNALTNLEHLQELTIDYNKTITNNFVEKVKGLRVLNCRGCTNLTDAGIIQVIKNCPDLERLDLSFIDNITLDTIIAADLATKNQLHALEK